MSDIQASVNLIHYSSGASVNGGSKRTANETSFSISALNVTTTPEAVPIGDIITPRNLAAKCYGGSDALLSLDGGTTYPFRLSSDSDPLLLRFDFESNRETSTFVAEADVAGSLSGDHLVIYDYVGTVWPWFNITDPTSVKEVSTVQTVADVADSLDGTYFLIYDNVGSVEVWINTSGGAAVAPGVGARAIEVPITTGATADAVATAIQTAVDADSKFVATVLTDTVTITDANYGARTDLTAGTSGFTVAVTTQGVTGIDPSVAPTVTTERLVQVDILANSTAIAVAVALAAALDADANFIAAVPTTSSAVIKDQHGGVRTAATAGDTGWASVTAGGDGAVYFDVYVKSEGTSEVAVAVSPN